MQLLPCDNLHIVLQEKTSMRYCINTISCKYNSKYLLSKKVYGQNLTPSKELVISSNKSAMHYEFIKFVID